MKVVCFLAYLAQNGFFAIWIMKFYDSIFAKSRIQKSTEMLCCALYFTAAIISQQFIAGIEIRLLCNLISLALLSLLYQDSWAKKVFSVLSLFLFINFVHYGLIFLSGRGRLLLFNPERYSFLIGIVIECILFFTFFILVTSIQHYLQNNTVAIVDWTIAIITPLCMVFLLCVSLARTENANNSLFFFSILLLLAVNILALFTHGFKIFRSRLKLISYQNRYYQNQLKIIAASESAFRGLRHDLKNHLVILFDSLNEGNVDYAKEYLTTIFTELDSPKTLSKTGNNTIDSLINYKLYNLSDLGIHLDYHAEVPSNLNIDPFDLTVILGNLLDNALDALKNLPLSKDKELSINLKYDSNRLIVKISNTYDGIIFSSNANLLTRKKDSAFHGIGLKNIRCTINKYNGNFKITYDQNHFTVYAIIYEAAHPEISEENETKIQNN